MRYSSFCDKNIKNIYIIFFLPHKISHHTHMCVPIYVCICLCVHAWMYLTILHRFWAKTWNIRLSTEAIFWVKPANKTPKKEGENQNIHQVLHGIKKWKWIYMWSIKLVNSINHRALCKKLLPWSSHREWSKRIGQRDKG